MLFALPPKITLPQISNLYLFKKIYFQELSSLPFVAIYLAALFFKNQFNVVRVGKNRENIMRLHKRKENFNVYKVYEPKEHQFLTIPIHHAIINVLDAQYLPLIFDLAE